ncbi:hypothetical protein D5R40_01845, partial [Okeania hirsuta]
TPNPSQPTPNPSQEGRGRTESGGKKEEEKEKVFLIALLSGHYITQRLYLWQGGIPFALRKAPNCASTDGGLKVNLRKSFY